MDTQIDTAQRRAADIHRSLVLAPTREARASNLLVLEEALQQTRRAALEEASKVCREFSKGYDMEWWRETPKTEIYKTACLEMIAILDRLREWVEGK